MVVLDASITSLESINVDVKVAEDEPVFTIAKKVAMVTCPDDVMLPHPTAPAPEEPPAVIIAVLLGGRTRLLREPVIVGAPTMLVFSGTAKGVPSVLKKSADAVTVERPAFVI